ncbi:MAG: hypothetical protein KatS3mg010_1134 [Acidimicrobiia bacterium]|nr:MAG: hypothetical protein KatS3mg010_1134 [Acidimicrobiia bacterium]
MNGVIVVSDETARSYLRATRGCPAKVHVVPNGVDTERYPAAVDRAGIRSELGLDDDHHVMTMVGTFKRQKGHSRARRRDAGARAALPRPPRAPRG